MLKPLLVDERIGWAIVGLDAPNVVSTSLTYRSGEYIRDHQEVVSAPRRTATRAST